MVNTCKHGFSPPSTCAICNENAARKKLGVPKKTPLLPPIRRTAPIPPPSFGGLEYVVVHTGTEEGEKRALARIDPRTKVVHIDGQLTVRILKQILAKAPNLEVLQLPPKAYEKLTDTHRTIIEARGVTLRSAYTGTGILMAEAWDRQTTSRAPQYKTLQRYLQELRGELLFRFQELLHLGFEEAEITRRYFCLGGEPFIPQRELGKLYGYSNSDRAAVVSKIVGAVLYYLDPTNPGTKDMRRKATAMLSRVIRLHQLRLNELSLQKIVQQLGLQKLPDGLPLSRLETFRHLMDLWRENGLQAVQPPDREILALRFGLNGGPYQTLETIGGQKGITRERVRQREARGLRALGIKEDE